jgi:hypothetical protein
LVPFLPFSLAAFVFVYLYSTPDTSKRTFHIAAFTQSHETSFNLLAGSPFSLQVIHVADEQTIHIASL